MNVATLADRLRAGSTDNHVIIMIDGDALNVGKIQDLVGTDPVDTIIETEDGAATHVTAGELSVKLADQDQEGDAQVFCGTAESFAYFDIGKVHVDGPAGATYIYAGAFRSGGG